MHLAGPEKLAIFLAFPPQKEKSSFTGTIFLQQFHNKI